MELATTRVFSRDICRFVPVFAAAMGGLLLAASSVFAQPYGRPVSQPFFDFDNSARFMNCRPGPYMWGFEPYLQVDECGEDCRAGLIVHRPASWYVIGDFAPMMYDANGTFPLAALGRTGTTVLTSNDLKPEFDSGGRITIGRTFGNGCYQIEGSYLGVYSWQDSITVGDNSIGVIDPAAAPVTTINGNLSSAFSNFSNPPIQGLDYNNRISVTDYNSFKTAEINFRTWLNVPPGPFDVQLLVGARYMKATEDYVYSAISALPAANTENRATILTQNDLYGVQIGIDMDFMINARMYVDFEVKGGILQNSASQNTTYETNVSPGNPGAPRTSSTPATPGDANSPYYHSGSKNCTAFFGDVSVVGNWQMAPNWNLRFGYQAIFVNGLALGPQNFQTSNSLLRTKDLSYLDHSGEAIYHGPVLGVMWTR